MQNHTIQIPEAYLLILAAQGKMGSGEIPKMMQRWAEEACEQLGLQQKMLDEKRRNYEEVKARAQNILGSNTVAEVENKVAVLAGVLKKIEART